MVICTYRFTIFKHPKRRYVRYLIVNMEIGLNFLKY